MTPVKKIDIHTHVIEERGILTPKGSTWLTAEELLYVSDELGIE